MTEPDRRSAHRAAIELSVEYKRLNTFFADYTRNISKGGTFIRTERPLAIGTEFVFALSILSEAVLSFLGIGAVPPTPSLGNIIAEGRDFVPVAPWVSLVPGMAIAMLVLGLNLLGDGLRDALDPRINVAVR